MLGILSIVTVSHIAWGGPFTSVRFRMFAGGGVVLPTCSFVYILDVQACVVGVSVLDWGHYM